MRNFVTKLVAASSWGIILAGVGCSSDSTSDPQPLEGIVQSGGTASVRGLANATVDPGGDGMVIFVGLAAPTQPGRTQ